MKRIWLLLLLPLALLAPDLRAQSAPRKAAAKTAQRASAGRLTSGFVTTSDHVRIHYLEASRDREDSSRPSLLFIPGWTMPAEIWEPQIRHFARTHRVVAMDPRSQGRSSRPAEGHYPAARARDIKAVVDQLQLEPVVLVGWSMGVIEVAAYVDQFGTDSLAGVVFVDGIAGGDFHPQLTPALLNFAGMHLKDRQKMADDFVRSMYKNPAVLKDEAYIRRIKTASLRTPTNAAIALFVGAFTTDMRPALAKLNRPALIVSAPGGPFDPSYEDMARRIAGSRHVKFEGAGHALFVDEPEKFNALLDDFLSSLAERVKER